MRTPTTPEAPALQLYEISAIVCYHTVIVAESREAALEHVSTWENAWTEPCNADLISVSDVDVFDVRPMKASADNWQAEAHDRTLGAFKLLTA